VELARGTVGEPSWAITLATLARRGFSGQLTLFAPDQKRFAIAFNKEALGHFHAVLMMQPNHRDASQEIRLLQRRLELVQ
jgi:hypothetical protein